MAYTVSLTVNVVVDCDDEISAFQEAVNIVEKQDSVYVAALNSVEINDYMVDA